MFGEKWLSRLVVDSEAKYIKTAISLASAGVALRQELCEDKGHLFGDQVLTQVTREWASTLFRIRQQHV